MTYAKQTWADGPGGNTPLSAARLQHIEDGIQTLEQTTLPAAYLSVHAVAAPTGTAATDTANIQAALDAAASAGGGIVALQAGNYACSGVTMASYVTLQGAGKKATRLLASANSVTLITVNGSSGTPATYTRIANLGLVANSMTGVVGIQGNYWNLGSAEDIWSSQLNWIIKTNNASFTHISRILTDELVNGIYLYKAVNTVVGDSTLSGASGTALLGVQVDSGCDGAELHHININAAATGVYLSHTDGASHYPYSTVCTAVQAGGGTGDGWQLYAGSGTQLTACIAVTMGGFGFRLRSPNGTMFSNCRAVNNGKNGVFIDAGGGATGNFSWIGGEVVGNGTANASTWEGFAVGNSCSAWKVVGATLGQYGAYANTQTYGLTVGTGNSDFTVAEITWGANLSANYSNGSTGTNKTGIAYYSAGNVTISSTTYVTVGFADLTVQARAGDVIEVGTGFRCDAGTGVLFMDVATIVSAAVVSYLSGNGSGGNGHPGWLRLGGAAGYVTGSFIAAIGSGDVSSGLCTVRLIAKVDSANRAIVNSGSEKIEFWVRNHGQPIAA